MLVKLIPGSATNLHNAQSSSTKEIAQNMLFSFTNISAEILLHTLGYSFCTESHILVHFLPNTLTREY
jgi:hypothetical protein